MFCLQSYTLVYWLNIFLSFPIEMGNTSTSKLSYLSQNIDFFTFDHPSNCLSTFTCRYLHYSSFSTLHSHEWPLPTFTTKEMRGSTYLHLSLFNCKHLCYKYLNCFVHTFHYSLPEVLIANTTWVLPTYYVSDFSGITIGLYHSYRLIKFWGKIYFPNVYFLKFFGRVRQIFSQKFFTGVQYFSKRKRYF